MVQTKAPYHNLVVLAFSAWSQFGTPIDLGVREFFSQIKGTAISDLAVLANHPLIS